MKTDQYLETVLKVAIHRKDKNPVFGESVTYVEITNEAAGPYIIISQRDTVEPSADFPNTRLKFDLTELEQVCTCARRLIANYPARES